MEPRYRNMQQFEHTLNRQYWQAIALGTCYSAVTWCGRAACTWGTVVLMGGFASNIAISDFSTITLLVIIIFILPGFAASTCKLVTKKSLSSGSLQPLNLTYQDKRIMCINLIKFSCVLLQACLSFWALKMVASKVNQTVDLDCLYSHVVNKLLHAHHAAALPPHQAYKPQHHDHVGPSSTAESCFHLQNGTSTSITNLQVSLFAFYILVVSTCFLALLCNLCLFMCVVDASRMLYSGSPKTLSLTRYHDEVLSRALNIGLLDAGEFDPTAFLLRGIGEDLVVRNIAPLEVKQQNEDFIKYLFHHPTGVEMVIGMLASEDILLQQVAANMPGFWSSEPVGMQKQGMELLSKLGEKLGMPGKVAEAAANSFKALAVAWKNFNASPLLTVYVSRSGGQRHRNSSRMSDDASTLASGEVGSGTLASVRGRVGGGESMNAVSRSEGGGRGTGQSDAAPPEPSDATSVMSQEEGQGSDGGSSHEPARSQGYDRNGGSTSEQVDEPEWNVVRKVVDLVANRRLPTLQVYVRALDSFFMSESVRNSLTPEETLQIKRKLLMIVQGRGSGRRSAANADDAPVAIDPSIKVRTQLLAFSALDRLGAEGPHDERWRGADLLRSLESRLEQVPERFLIWKDEVQRYEELCAIYSHAPGPWLTSGNWAIRGANLTQ